MPGEARRDHLLAEVTPADDDAGYQPPVLVGVVDLQARRLTEGEDTQVQCGLPAERLALFRRVDAFEADPPGARPDRHIQRVTIGDVSNRPRERPRRRRLGVWSSRENDNEAGNDCPSEA